MTGEDAGGEARGESLDLRLDPLAHVDRRTIRHMAVGPTDVLAGRRPAGVGDGGLSEDHEGPLGHRAGGHRLLGGDNLIEGAANVDGAGPPASFGAPGDWPIQRPVDLEDAGSVSKPLELPAE